MVRLSKKDNPYKTPAPFGGYVERHYGWQEGVAAQLRAVVENLAKRIKQHEFTGSLEDKVIIGELEDIKYEYEQEAPDDKG